MDELSMKKQWAFSQLNNAINCLTYGINCLYFDKATSKLKECLLSVHEQYINIIHVIIDGSSSVLFEIQNIKSISDKDIYIKKTLNGKGFEHFLIVYTSALESHVLVMASENQINVLWEGLQYFVYEATNFYFRISLMDPFKAESAMLFMDADVDGSKLLDIEEVFYIFKKLRIKKDTEEIEQSILQINEDLYEKENLKKPKDFAKNMLTPLGFQYILQFYSLKAGLAPLFTQFCPIFKFKHKKFKKSILDILKSQTKPLMSGIQFQQFMHKFLKIQKTEAECIELIKSFPVYDGEGKQIPEQVEFLSFHNFCNFVFNPSNCMMENQKKQVYQDMNLPLTEYYIYSSTNSHPANELIFDSQLQAYQFSLKKGARCIQIFVYVQKQEIMVKNYYGKKILLLVDVLKTIKNICFSFNPFPIILSLDCHFSSLYAQKVAVIFKTQLGESLYVGKRREGKQDDTLPSPLQLKNKILLQLIGSSKKSKEEDNMFFKLITLNPVKLDFQRKGQNCWDTCQISTKQILKHEQIQDINLTNYCRKIMVRAIETQNVTAGANYDSMPMFRNGIQLATINMDTEDQNHYFLHSKFLENGGKSCGYLIKPHWMRADCMESLYASSFVKQVSLLKLRFYAGQKFVLTDTISSKFILKVYMKGSKLQQARNKKYESEPKTQGFYSDFQVQCEFVIFCPDLATIVMSIEDQTGKILSYRAISYRTIREGLRIVELLGPGMETFPGSFLLVDSIIIQEKKKRKLSNILK